MSTAKKKTATSSAIKSVVKKAKTIAVTELFEVVCELANRITMSPVERTNLLTKIERAFEKATDVEIPDNIKNQ